MRWARLSHYENDQNDELVNSTIDFVEVQW
jgi:hypothetical protein